MRTTAALLLIAAYAPFALAQSPAPGAASPNAPQVIGSSTDSDYHVGPGDLIAVSIFGMDEFAQAARISNSGKIHLTHLGILRVADKTPSELAAEIAEMLKGRGLVREPWVQVRVLEYRAHPVYILGEVMQPGQFVLTGEKYLADLLTEAVGFNDVASPIGYLYRRKPVASRVGSPQSAGSSSTETTPEMMFEEAIEIDFRALEDGRKPELNVRLRAGDVLYCPERRPGLYFAVGGFMSPGRHKVPDDRPLTLSRAIAIAGGPSKNARTSKGAIVRYDAQGNRHEIPFDGQAVLEGRQPDVNVETMDILFLPSSTAKTVGYAFLNVIPGVLWSGLGRIQ
jgi:polysaccharide export outer membrane protein